MVKNLTSGKIISNDAKIAQSIIDKSFGMLLPKNSAGIILKTRFGIHTLLMRKPIDIIIVDKEKEVVQIRENMKPNRFLVWNPKLDTVIEVESGAVKSSKTHIGDKLDF